MSKSKRRYDVGAAARRAAEQATQSNVPAVDPERDAGSEAGSTDAPTAHTHGRAREYELISVHQIEPAPWQPRLIFRDIEELAASILGDSDTDGVGVLEPVLVRRLAEGRYQLLDGERRWRAAKLIARGRPDGDFLLPARVFEVSERIARIIAQTANIERSQPSALEIALGYQRIREALEEESPGRHIGVRRLAGIGWHKRSQAAGYAKAADLTAEVLRAAGVLDADGRADERVIVKLTLRDLLAAVAAPTPEAQIQLLRARVDRLRGVKRQPAADPAADAVAARPATFEERLEQLRTEGGLTVRVREPLLALAPAAAVELLARDIAPAVLALTERAHGRGRGAGYLARTGSDHTLLVVPCEVEQLSAAQLEALSRELTSLGRRVARAARFRRGHRGGKAADAGPGRDATTV